MIIAAPGIYDLPSEVYHADPCETPSLSAGMITELLGAPAKCFANSKRLNPNYEEEEDTGRFTIGSVSHVIFLEPHLFEEKVVICNYDDWRTKDAKAMRADANSCGKTPILAKHMQKVLEARDAFFAHSFTRTAFQNGQFEQSLFWKHPIYGFWCRARPDFIASNRSYLNDYKATGNADPSQFGRHAYAMGYHRRAAWYLQGCEVLFGKKPDHYWFCNQEIKAPFLPSVVELDEMSIEAGRQENNRGAEIFATCLKTGEWYGYRHATDPSRDLAFQVGLPNYAYIQMDERNFL